MSFDINITHIRFKSNSNWKFIDKISSYDLVVENDASVFIHYKNIQTLEASPAIVSDTFLP